VASLRQAGELIRPQDGKMSLRTMAWTPQLLGQWIDAAGI